MKAFRCPQKRHVLLATLLCVIMAGGGLLASSGAETKSKKSSSKSASSSTSKAKKTTPKSSKPTSKAASASKSARSTPKTKKAATSTASKAKKQESSSGQKSRSGKKETGAETEPAASTPAPEIPGQPAPDLPKAEPSANAGSAPADSATAAETASGETKPMPVGLSVAPPTPPATPAPADKPANSREKPASVAPNVSLDPEDLLGFEEQPPRVQRLITAALELARRKLTYTYGSADPSNGGMDCSGAIQYLLTQEGFQDVPRDASGQYVWARKGGAFFAVVSKKADSFEFGDLLPGDLLFWNGTYNTDRDPPVTHTMIYLGVQRKRAQHVMWGASDGRTYDSKPRWGVSVFDFKMPRADKKILDGAKADFLGYARIPGLRE